MPTIELIQAWGTLPIGLSLAFLIYFIVKFAREILRFARDMQIKANIVTENHLEHIQNDILKTREGIDDLRKHAGAQTDLLKKLVEK